APRAARSRGSGFVRWPIAAPDVFDGTSASMAKADTAFSHSRILAFPAFPHSRILACSHTPNQLECSLARVRAKISTKTALIILKNMKTTAASHWNRRAVLSATISYSNAPETLKPLQAHTRSQRAATSGALEF